MIEAGLFGLLSADPGITAICQTRIYPTDFPTGPTYPAMAYKTVVAPQRPTMSGTGMQHWRMQFNCRAESAMAAAGLRAALIGALNTQMQVTLSDGTLLQSATLHGLSDDFMSASRVYDYMADITLDFNFQS